MQLFLTGKPTYPVERTLLTTGLTAAGVESLYQKQKKLETPLGRDIARGYHELRRGAAGDRRTIVVAATHGVPDPLARGASRPA